MVITLWNATRTMISAMNYYDCKSSNIFLKIENKHSSDLNKEKYVIEIYNDCNSCTVIRDLHILILRYVKNMLSNILLYESRHICIYVILVYI